MFIRMQAPYAETLTLAQTYNNHWN